MHVLKNYYTEKATVRGSVIFGAKVCEIFCVMFCVIFSVIFV